MTSRNTRLAGHTLLRAGDPYFIDGCTTCQPAGIDLAYGGQFSRDWAGHGRCSCGDASECLGTYAERKRWHAAHKDEIRSAR